MTPFTGKVAVVTGGSRGIGLAIARALVERGTHVVISATSETTLGAAVGDLQRFASDGARVVSVEADVRRYEDIQRLFDSTVQKFGGLDILINNAGIGVFRRVADMSVNDWHRVIDTNLTGVFYCCHAALPLLRERGGGWIINISSLASINPFPEAAAYCASKTALNAFTDALMQEVRHEGIRVACLLPGSVRTDFGGKVHGADDWKLAPADVADVVADLIKHPGRSLPSRVDIRPAKPPKKA